MLGWPRGGWGGERRCPPSMKAVDRVIITNVVAGAMASDLGGKAQADRPKAKPLETLGLTVVVIGVTLIALNMVRLADDKAYDLYDLPPRDLFTILAVTVSVALAVAFGRRLASMLRREAGVKKRGCAVIAVALLVCFPAYVAVSEYNYLNRPYVAYNHYDRLEATVFSPEDGNFAFRGQGMPDPVASWERSYVFVGIRDEGARYAGNEWNWSSGKVDPRNLVNGIYFAEIPMPTLQDPDDVAQLTIVDADRDGMVSNGDLVLIHLPEPLEVPEFGQFFVLEIHDPEVPKDLCSVMYGSYIFLEYDGRFYPFRT